MRLICWWAGCRYAFLTGAPTWRCRDAPSRTVNTALFLHAQGRPLTGLRPPGLRVSVSRAGGPPPAAAPTPCTAVETTGGETHQAACTAHQK